MDSNHEVNNKGTITITDSNGATGILALPNTTGAITNSGTITIDETYAPTDADKDGDIDGTFAQGSGRYGIRVGDKPQWQYSQQRKRSRSKAITASASRWMARLPAI